MKRLILLACCSHVDEVSTSHSMRSLAEAMHFSLPRCPSADFDQLITGKKKSRTVACYLCHVHLQEYLSCDPWSSGWGASWRIATCWLVLSLKMKAEVVGAEVQRFPEGSGWVGLKTECKRIWWDICTSMYLFIPTAFSVCCTCHIADI